MNSPLVIELKTTGVHLYLEGELILRVDDEEDCRRMLMLTLMALNRAEPLTLVNDITGVLKIEDDLELSSFVKALAQYHHQLVCLDYSFGGNVH